MPTVETAITTTPITQVLLFFELGLMLLGVTILLRRIAGAPKRFLGLAPAGLAHSPYRPSELFLATAFAFGGAVILQVVASQIADRLFPKPEVLVPGLSLHDVVLGAGFQIGLLAGLAYVWFMHLRPERRVAEPGELLPPAVRVVPLIIALREGGSAFVTALPLVALTGFAWKYFLDLFGIESSPQDLVTLFSDSRDHVALGLIVLLAVFVAPIAEELVFRIGLFRWLRTRTLRSIALFVPALTFAALHGNVAVFLPLVVLAICLALSYERVGHPLVPIIGHALFNLNTLLLLFAGVET